MVLSTFFEKFLSKVSYLITEAKSPKVSEITNLGRSLVLAPHPDDESIGCAGVMIKFPEVTDVVCITDGRYGDPEISQDQMIEIRKREFFKAIDLCSVRKGQMLNVTDGKLIEGYEALKGIDYECYENIFIPNFLDRHHDHKAVSDLLLQLIVDGYISKNKKLFFYEVWGTCPFINSYIDLSGLQEKKKQLIDCHASQIKHIDYSRKILSLNEYRGLALEVGAAECYLKLTVRQFINFMDSKCR